MVFLIGANETEVLPGQGLEEVVDQLRAMLLQEQTHYTSCPDYLKAGESFTDPLKVTNKWRLRICEWIFEVIDHFDFDRDVASTALAYMDRSVAAALEATGTPVSKQDYQLYAVTSLYIAVKLHGDMDETAGARKKLKIDAFQELSRGFFTVESIETMERRILSLLKWRMNPPTPSQFILQLLRFLPRWSVLDHQHTYETAVTKLYDVAKYLSELSYCDGSICFESTPSFVAYASVLCAIEALRDTTPLPHEVTVRFLRNIAVASEVLLPGIQQTLVLQRKLRDLSPSLFSIRQSTLARSVSFDEDDTTCQVFSSTLGTTSSLVRVIDGGTDNTVKKKPRMEY